MPCTKETVRALVSAFNIHNYARDTVETNFTLQNRGERDCIVVSFDKGMDCYQCRRHLSDIKKKITHEFYNIKKDTDEAILNTAKLIFDIESFPFDISKGVWHSNEGNNRLEFIVPIDEGVIFNLKSYLASSLKKDVLEDMRVSSTTTVFDKEKYLWQDKLPSKGLCKQFEVIFSSRMKERYKNVPDKFLKVKGNDVYIRNAFDDARFIDSITQYTAWLTGMSLHADSKARSDVKALKDLIMQFINQSTGIMLAGFMCTSPLGRREASILIPVIRDSEGARLLTREEALKLNDAFDEIVCGNINDKTQAELSVHGNSGVYGINFSDPHISHCVVTKIIESSAINKDHKLTIDPELHFRVLSPEPPVSPVHPSRQELSDTAKEEIAMRFIRKLPLGKNEKLIGEILPYTFSHEGRVKLYSILFSARERDEVYLALSFSSEKIREVESNWCSLHEQHGYPKSQLDSIAISKECPKQADGALGSGENAPRVESKSPEKEQNILQRTWSRWLGGSKENSPVHSPSGDNIPGLPPVPPQRTTAGTSDKTKMLSLTDEQRRELYLFLSPEMRNAKFSPDEETYTYFLYVDKKDASESKSERAKERRPRSKCNTSNTSTSSEDSVISLTSNSSLSAKGNTTDSGVFSSQESISGKSAFSRGDRQYASSASDSSNNSKTSVDTIVAGGEKDGTVFVPCPQTQLTELQCTGARKKIICPEHPWAAVGTATSALASHAKPVGFGREYSKRDIDDLEKTFFDAVTMVEKEEFGSSESGQGYWRNIATGCSNKQATKEKSSWVRE